MQTQAFGKGKKSVYDQVAKSPVARQQLSRCGDNLALTEEVLEQLFAFTRSIIYGDNKSKTMAEARAAKWRTIKKKSFIRLPPDNDSLRQHCLRANYLAYLVRHPSLKHHPSPIGHGWELVGGCCRPVRHTRPALPMHLPAPRPTEEGQEDEEDESDDDDEIELLLSREAIHRNRRIQNVARQGALIQTDTDSQCHIDK
ncbi:hypothetical protein KUCAC02_000525 [Chaenocephalus aceratus]|uniref:Uncharacterized protein n=1 Tax=Chaenocephalus aceratus TaxID=36190 RepID=A0ACB9W5T5_CHAAC|nr:hypothetical protein KUCAC02_000525 [Chaenocephalus aceratus]